MVVLDNWGSHPSIGNFLDQRTLQARQIGQEREKKPHSQNMQFTKIFGP